MKRKNKLFLIGLAIILILGPMVYFGLLRPHKTAAGWFDEGWHYRKAVTITNSYSSGFTNYQVSVNVGTSALIAAGKMQSDCDDLRFTDINGKLIPHWIEENNPGCNTVTDTKIWVKTPSLPPSTSTFYLYYGNPSVINDENGNDVFEFFDDFSGSALNSNRWTQINGTSLSLSGGTLSITASADPGKLVAISAPTGWDYVLRSRFKANAGTSTGERMGVGIGTSSANGYGYNFALRDFTATNMVGFLNDMVAWGNTAPYSWSKGTYYTMEIHQDAKFVKGRINDGSWYSQSTWDGFVGYPALNFGSVSGTTSTWDWAVVRKRAPASEPTSSVSSTEELGKGPVAYWKFDEGYGTTANDSTSSRNNGTLGVGNSTPTWQTENMCLSGKCLRFLGGAYMSSYVQASNSVPVSNIFTISHWIKTTDTGGYTVSNAGSDNGYRLGENGNGVSFLIGKGGGTYTEGICGTKTVNDNNWHMITGIYNNTTNKFTCYIDGIYEAEVSIVDFSGFSTTAPAIGGYLYEGFIDEVKIYPYARTAAEIKAEFNARGSLEGAAVQVGSDNQPNALSNGFIGYWNFNNGSGTTVPDLSGNNYTLTLGTGNSAPGWANGMYGIGASFDGSNDYSSTTVSQIPTANGSKFTLSFWMKWDGTDAKMPVSFGTNSNFDIFMLSGNFGINTWAGDLWGISSSGFSNTWKHITYVFYNGDLKNSELYIDGQKQITSQRAGTINNTNVAGTSVYIGSGPSPSYQWGGILDEVRIYNRALSPAEVRQLYDWAPEPVVHLKMDEGVGSTAYDSSGYQINGGLGTGTSAPTWKPGKYGNGLGFDGNDTAEISDNSNLRLATSMTVSTWFKTTDTTADRGIIRKDTEGGGTRYLWGFSLSPSGGTNKIGAQFYNGVMSQVVSTNNVNDGLWHYATMTISGTTLTLYVDGINVGQTAIAGTQGIPDGRIGIGAHPPRATGGWGYFLTGQIDDVKIYNYTRTQKQIVQDMNANHPAIGSQTPIGYWKFDEGYSTTAYNSGSAGSNLNGTLSYFTSPPTDSSGWTNNGKYNRALIFDGATGTNQENVNLGNKSELETQEMTISAWVYRKGDCGAFEECTIMAYGQTGYQGYALAVTKTGSYYKAQFNINDLQKVYGNTTINTNQWYYIAGSIDGSTIKLYVNGKLDSTNVQSYTPDYSSNSNIIIGNKNTNLDIPMNGIIDEVKFYNFTLTEDEVKLDYNRSSALQLGTISTGTGNTASSTAASQKYCIPGDASTCSAPIAEWNFEENIGTSVYDTSGNNYTGTLGSGNSAPSWSAGYLSNGAGANFADTDWINIGNILHLSLPVTITTWVKTNAIGSYQGIFANDKTTDQHSGIWMGILPSGAIETAFGDNLGGGSGNRRSVNSLTTLSTNRWYHIGAVVNGATDMQLYLDGVAIGTTYNGTGGTIAYASTVGAIGRAGSGNHFNGTIDQLKVYNYARSPAQIAWDYNKGAPIAHWKLDEGEGVTVNNASLVGSAINGTLGTGNSAPGWVNGMYGIGGSFDGNDYVEITDSTVFDIYGGGFTYSAWINPSSYPSSYGMIMGHYLPYFCIRDNGLLFSSFTDGTQRTLYGKTALSIGQWYHAVTTYDSQGYLKIYLNGLLETTAGPYGTVSNSAGNQYIGTWWSGRDGLFKGLIDDVRIYNYALTATQVKNLYNENSAVRFGE